MPGERAGFKGTHLADNAINLHILRTKLNRPAADSSKWVQRFRRASFIPPKTLGNGQAVLLPRCKWMGWRSRLFESRGKVRAFLVVQFFSCNVSLDMLANETFVHRPYGLSKLFCREKGDATMRGQSIMMTLLCAGLAVVIGMINVASASSAEPKAATAATKEANANVLHYD